MTRKPKNVNIDIRQTATAFDEQAFVDGVFNDDYIFVVEVVQYLTVNTSDEWTKQDNNKDESNDKMPALSQEALFMNGLLVSI